MSNELLIDFGQQTDDRKKWLYEVFYKQLLTEDGKKAFRDRIRCDVVDYCWHCAEPKRWKGCNRFQQWAEQLNVIGERLRPFREELEQQQMMKYQEVRFNLISLMKTVANTPGSMHSMQKLEDILWNRVINNGRKSAGEIGYELYQDMQGYMMQAKENLRRQEQQQRIEVDSRKQSEELMLRSLGNEA